MKINRDNYEAYFLDYHEGQLSPEMAEEVQLFVAQNPDLKNMFEEFEAVSLVTDQDVVFEMKSSLKKNHVFATSQVNELNYEEFMLAETEGLLTAEQASFLDEFVSINPQFAKDRSLYRLSHLTADGDIIFEAKESLKKIAIPVGAIDAGTYETFMARELEADLGEDEKSQMAEFMLYNPHLQGDRQLYQHTMLSPETNVVFENKSTLKQSVIPVRLLVYYALSAAASLALIFSVYFLLDRNPVAPELAQRDNVKTTSSAAASRPNPGIPESQLSSSPEKPAKAVSDPVNTNNNLIVPQQTADHFVPDPEAVAMIDRSTVEPLVPRLAGEVHTRQFVDPQFTFIRVSQMYLNQNLEFYYNLKLAEELQYAQVNSIDDTPVKTIFNAISDKANELLAFNHSAPEPVKDEKRNLSVWTFAELGVQTFNTVTSSELELKLRKDEEGKVVAYGLEGGRLDFEKQLKK